MSSKENFISYVCDAFQKAVESASGVTLEGREREFRHVLARRLFDETLGWEGHSKIGEIYDITCFDDEDFPIIVIETKWGVKPTHEIKEKLRKRIEELGSVKYGVFASERDFIVYAYGDYKLREITKVNVAEGVGVAKGEYGLSEIAKRRILKLQTLKRERLVWIEDPDYFERTYKGISVAKREGVELLTENLKSVVGNLTTVLTNFFESYWKRKEHYSGRFLENTFNDWLRLSMKDENFKKGNENERRKIVEVFCRETAYILVGKILFTRICEDKDITKLTISGKGLAESLRYYKKRRKKPYLIIFDESREEIRKYYTHLYKLGYFDWWWISPEKIGVLRYEDKRIQDTLEEDLNDSIRKMFRRFNRFDFTQVDRDILGDVYQGYLPPDERKQLGEFYTPKEVIDYILDAIGYKPENEIRGKRILDPACGSGSFIVEATQRLTERYRRIGFNLKDPDEAKQIIEECIGSIYGLDIHPFACVIAEINLLFQLVDLYNIVRRKDRHYKLPRLNIFRTDSLMPFGETVIQLVEFADNSRREMLIEETIGANRVKNTSFDYIAGNPPYVRIQRLEQVKKYLKSIYETTFGRFDIYVPFIERGIKWLNDSGFLGFICSDQFMNRHYGRKLRHFVLEHCAITQIVDFGDSGVFKDVTNYPCILIVEKKKKEENSFKCVKVFKPRDNLLDDIRKNFNKGSYKSPYYDLFTVNQKTISDEIWKLNPKEERNLLDKIGKNSLLEEIPVEIFAGLESGKDFIYFINSELSEKLEKDILKPLLMGKNVKKYGINPEDNYVIYPYEVKNGKAVAISEKDFESKYPRTLNYLFEHKEILENRKWFGKRPEEMNKEWYELMWESNPTGMESQRIIVPRISNINNFALEEGKYYGNTEVYNIILDENMKAKYGYEFVLGLLNSRVVEFFLKNISPILSGRYYRYDKQFLSRLPIKLPSNLKEEETSKEITLAVREVLGLNKVAISLGGKTENFPDSYLDKSWSYDKVTNLIKAKSLSKSSYSVSKKSFRTDYLLRDLDGKETFRIILATNEYLDFYSENVASYVFEVLKTLKRVTKRELLELKIPQEPHLKNLLNQYRKDKEQIVKNKKAVKELEKQIDDLVYKLYDITHKERRIIEEYLAKF